VQEDLFTVEIKPLVNAYTSSNHQLSVEIQQDYVFPRTQQLLYSATMNIVWRAQMNVVFLIIQSLHV